MIFMSIPRHTPPVTKGNRDEFYFTTSGAWQPWNKPRGVSMISIFCIGGGGGGGSGIILLFPSTSGGGGGGGGGSSQTVVMLPASFVPDVLYVQVGGGGAANTSGALSYVSVDQSSTTINNILCVSGTAAALGGANATVSAGGNGAAGGTAATLSVMPLAGLGVYNFIAGQNGTNGGAASASGTGVNQTFPTTGAVCMGGCGGAGTNGTDLLGGGITAASPANIFNRFIVPNSTSLAVGPDGFCLRNSTVPFFSFPGLGASSNASATKESSIGGKGGYGSGGGGGGTGTSLATGGRGGDGLVIITSW